MLQALGERYELEFAEVGGTAYEAHGHALPEATLKLAQDADAVLFGAVGDWKYDKLERALRPEQAILGLRRSFGFIESSIQDARKYFVDLKSAIGKYFAQGAPSAPDSDQLSSAYDFMDNGSLTAFTDAFLQFNADYVVSVVRKTQGR